MKEWVTTTIVLNELSSGKEDAWNAFSKDCHPMLVKFGVKLGLSHHNAEDAAQDTMMTFVRLYREGKYIRGEGGGLRKWFFGIAYNVIRDVRRRLPREMQVADETTGTSFFESVEDKNIEQTWDDGWQGMILAKCLDRVRREYRKDIEIFELLAVHGKSVSEVATQFNKTENAIYSIKHKILKRIGKLKSDFEKGD